MHSAEVARAIAFVFHYHLLPYISLLNYYCVAYGTSVILHVWLILTVCLIFKSDSWKYGADFFRTEYLLNYIIANV
jgi:hypothetical protein